MTEELRFLEEQGIEKELIQAVERFRRDSSVDPEAAYRIVRPSMPFYGKEILEMAIAALLQGENLLLTGSKATGKNVLAENLAWIFGRPSYNISFHVNTGSAELIGTDTFMDNQDAVSVLHATLDYRRSIDVPGYDKIDLHPAARFIGTMNYGYAGTKELNEALVSRFLVIAMPDQTEETLLKIMRKAYPTARETALEQFAGLFLDLQLKAANGEISTKAVDLRGILAAVGTMKTGLSPALAVRMGVVNKCFDNFEREIVEDVVMTRIPADWTRDQIFEV